jgi:hypothetical protein
VDERCYYACSAEFDSSVRFFLWYSDEPDGVVLDDGKIRTFSSRQALAQYCQQHGLPLSDESTAIYDFDIIDSWITDPNGGQFDISRLLNAWNMMDDFYKSTGSAGAIPDEYLDLHEKLSLSNFAVSIPEFFKGKRYEPNWTDSDRIRLASALKETTTRFKAAL